MARNGPLRAARPAASQVSPPSVVWKMRPSSPTIQPSLSVGEAGGEQALPDLAAARPACPAPRRGADEREQRATRRRARTALAGASSMHAAAAEPKGIYTRTVSGRLAVNAAPVARWARQRPFGAIRRQNTYSTWKRTLSRSRTAPICPVGGPSMRV